MRSFLIPGFVLCCALALGACNDAPETATLSIRTVGLAEGDEIEIWDERKRIGAFQDPPLAAAGPVDRSGQFRATIEVETAGVYWLIVRSKGSAWLYLHPGQHLEIAVDGGDWRNSLTFEGDFAADQAVFQSIQRASYDGAPRGLDTLDAETFVRQALDYEERLRTTVAAQLHDNDVSGPFRRHVGAWVDAQLYFTRYNFTYSHARAGRTVELPDDLFDRETILQRHRDLIGEVPQIRRLAEIPISDSIATFIRNDPPLDSDIDWQTDYKLRRIDEGPDDFRRPFLYAGALVQYVALAGTTPRVDAAIEAYGDRLRPRDRAVLDQLYQSFKDMEDRPAPDFPFQLSDGTEMRLSDLEGKVVYIDVWATWCAPCLVEMPFSNDLRTKFSDREDLVFLYVSVDTDRFRWQQMLESRTDFGGLHGITPDGWEGPLTDGYRITGIPRTILIDRDGTLVRVSAPSPSSEQIVPLLDELLGSASG